MTEWAEMVLVEAHLEVVLPLWDAYSSVEDEAPDSKYSVPLLVGETLKTHMSWSHFLTGRLRRDATQAMDVQESTWDWCRMRNLGTGTVPVNTQQLLMQSLIVCHPSIHPGTPNKEVPLSKGLPSDW